MEIVLFADNTVGVSLRRLAELLSSSSSDVRVTASKSRFRPTEDCLVYEHEHASLCELAALEGKFDAAFFLTARPFENNFFYLGLDNMFLMSVSGWEHLTDLPISNGICYLITTAVMKYLLLEGRSHDESTGCVNDYMWDKSIINVGMRAAFVCERCRSLASKEVLSRKAFAHFSLVLDMISAKSRNGIDLLDGASSLDLLEPAEKSFDVFLCHNSKDKPAVRLLNARLKAAGIKTWFDEESLMPGELWQDELEKQICSIRVCAVIVGPNGEGPWQENERRTFINEFITRSCPIIPVIISGASAMPALPLFLRNFMWCDLRNDDETQFGRLVTSIRRATLNAR